MEAIRIAFAAEEGFDWEAEEGLRVAPFPFFFIGVGEVLELCRPTLVQI